MKKNQKKTRSREFIQKNQGKYQNKKAPINRKQQWKPGNMIYPVPAVMVSVADKAGNDNIITVAWTGTVCTNPPMAYISVRPERYSYHMIKETGEFVINLTTKDLTFALDYCGVKSGRDIDKFDFLKLTRQKALKVAVPMIGESPINIECRVTQSWSLLGSKADAGNLWLQCEEVMTGSFSFCENVWIEKNIFIDSQTVVKVINICIIVEYF